MGRKSDFRPCRFRSKEIRSDFGSNRSASKFKGEPFTAMKVEIKDNKLYIEIDLEKPTPSSSGKTLVVASTRGNTVTTAQVNGKPVTIGLNAYIKP